MVGSLVGLAARSALKKAAKSITKNKSKLPRTSKKVNTREGYSELRGQVSHTVRFNKDGKGFAVPFKNMSKAKKTLSKIKNESGVTKARITKDLLKSNVSFKK